MMTPTLKILISFLSKLKTPYDFNHTKSILYVVSNDQPQT